MALIKESFEKETLEACYSAFSHPHLGQTDSGHGLL